MADNLKQLTQDVGVAINPAGAPGSILAVNHKSVLTQVIEKAGKYTGLPFVAKLQSANGIIMPGTFVWNGNAMNESGDFIITVSKYTSDMNDVGHYLSLLAEGTLIHFKDFVGRSVILKYKSHAPDFDGISNEVFNISVSAAPENTNYTYQANESEVCMIEFFGAGSSKDYFQGVELDLFWKGRGWSDEHLETEFYKFVERKKLIEKDTITNIISYKTIDTKVCLLGISIKNFGAIANLSPQIVIERYKRPRGNSTATRGHQYPAGYRSTFRYNDQIKAEVIENTNLIGKELIDRPQVIDVQSEMAYYDIFAENYFSQIDPPKVLGNNNCLTHPKSAVLPLKDNSGTKTRNVPVRQKGKVHLRLRLRLTTPEKGLIESDVLAYFKIIDSMIFVVPGIDQVEAQNVIKYSFE